VEIGVLACESDDRELIQIHDVFSFRVDLLASSVFGHPKGERPAPKRDEVLCWGDRAEYFFGGAEKAERNRVPGAGLK
jgi:hypothetical protein